MKNIKKHEIDYNTISEIYKDMDMASLLSEADIRCYDNINIMTDEFKTILKINEAQFNVKFNSVLSEIIGYSNNLDSIQSQLPGQFIFNKDHKEKFLNILPGNKESITKVIEEWNKVTSERCGSKEINDRTIDELFSIGFPYVYLALTVKKEELSMNILFMLNLLMYSMAYAQSFPKFEYNRDKGQYVIQNILKNKGFAKYESIIDLIMKTSKDTHNTYSTKLSDRVIYETLWSNIQQKMKYYIKQFHEAYQSIGNKYLTTNKDLLATTDRDGNASTVESNIENDSAVVMKIVKSVTGYVDNPNYLESNLVKFVLFKILGVDSNSQRANIEKKTLVERNFTAMVEDIQKTRDFEAIITNVLQNFLWSDEKKKLDVNHIETPFFIDKINYDVSYIRKSNVHVNKIIELMDKHIDSVLGSRGKSVDSVDNKTLQKYRKALIYYFALLTQYVVKRS